MAMYPVSDTIRHKETREGGILLDVHHGQLFGLNIVGIKVVEMIRRGQGESEIAAEISRDYGVNKDVVWRDVARFIEALRRKRLAGEHSGPKCWSQSVQQYGQESKHRNRIAPGASGTSGAGNRAQKLIDRLELPDDVFRRPRAC